MTTGAVEAVDPIVERLRALVQESPDLSDAAQLYETILPILRDTDLRAGPVSISPDQAQAKMEMGLPLLCDLDLELDGQAARKLMLQLARAIERFGEKNQPLSTAARQIRLALKENKFSIGDLLPHVAAAERGLVTSAAQSLQLDAILMWTLAQNTLKPAMRAWCRQLTPLGGGDRWYKGRCFICGTTATLAELQENTQAKHLRCGQCGADWRFSRLQCMYCGNDDHNTLHCLYAESRREIMRVEVCDKCNGYLKVVSSFAPTPPEMLPVEDLATLHLDYIAQERGYARVMVQ